MKQRWYSIQPVEGATKPPWRPTKNPHNRTVGSVATPHTMPILVACILEPFSSGTAKRGCLCESVRNLQGSKSPKSGKEGFWGEKLPFPNVPDMGAFSQKIPISQGSTRKVEIFSKRPFLWDMGVF